MSEKPTRLEMINKAIEANAKYMAAEYDKLMTSETLFWKLHKEKKMKPTIGRIVIYTSKIDNGPGNNVLSPAIVLRTQDTTVPEVIKRWGPMPSEVGPSPVDGKTHQTSKRPEGVLEELPDENTIDLLVFGLGRNYREYAVKHDPEGGLGTWRWPERIN